MSRVSYLAVIVAGIFNTLLLNTRERLRDTATLKALGMSPRQVIMMVAASAAFLALVGGVVAVPAGVGLSRFLFDLVSSIGGDRTPSAAYGGFAPWELIALPLVGVAFALAAALIPAGGRRAPTWSTSYMRNEGRPRRPDPESVQLATVVSNVTQER